MWQELKKPIMVLAPMADVTDAAFRRIIAKYSKPFGPDLFFTEFTSADGLCHKEGAIKLQRELFFSEEEKPIIVQLFSANPDKLRQASLMVAKMGFAGIDINMGCPDRNIEKQGCGASLIKNPSLAKELVLAAKESGLPVSVKTRIGYNQTDLENWTKHLLEVKPAAITFHLRTRKEMSKVDAHWELASIPVSLAKGTNTLILGNGDVSTVYEAKTKASLYGLDGVMLGRAIYGNPWLFSGYTPSVKEKLMVLIEHVEAFEELFRPGEVNTKLFSGHTKSFAVMKKHFKAYVNDFPQANELRSKLMEQEDGQQVKEIILHFLASQDLL